MAASALAGLLVLAAAASPDALLQDAEARLFAGDAEGALVALAGAGSSPRRLRLEADAHVALHDRQARSLLDALAHHPEWEQHARRQQAAFEAAEQQQDRVRVGSILFAMTLALLILAGARELLRIRIETLVCAIGAALALLILGQLSKPLMSVAGVVALAALALVHAGTAAVRRTGAESRVRAMIAMTMLLGFGGVVWAVAAQIGLGGLFALLSQATMG